MKKALLSVIMLLVATQVIAQVQRPQGRLVIAIRSDFEPFTFLNAEGKPAGMFVDIWRLWANKTGKQIEFISSDLKTSLENLKNQKADVHSGLFTPERLEWMGSSRPFYEAGINLFYPLKQGRISNIRELSGQTVATLRGSQPEQFLKKNHPDIRTFPCDTIEELVKVSREGKVKGFVIVSPAGTAVIDRMGLSGEFETHERTLYKEKFHAGVFKGNTELLTVVDKGLSAISDQEWAEIEARWIPDPAMRYYKTSNILRLTPAEEAWLRGHKTIRVGMSPTFPPLKFSEKGVIKGIEPDYLNLLSEYTGIQFEYVICDFSVMDVKVKSGEMDMFLSFVIPQRLSYMTFTEPFMEFKQVIIARNDTPFMSGIGALRGKKMATVKGVKLYDKLLGPYPEIEAVPVNSLEEMFRAVSESKADALIAQTFLAGYMMPNYFNLKAVGVPDLPPEPYLYAVRKDYPELVGILNKAIQSIPKDRFDTIVQKWFTIRVEYRPNWSEILKWAGVIGVVFALILGLTLFWNRRLANEIYIRKLAADRELLAREVLHLLNRPEDETDVIRDILLLIKKHQDFEAVGIRLKQGDDFPYFQTDGFPDHFVKAENYLCVRNGEGKILRDAAGNPMLACMCGNIVCGRTDTLLPFFTDKGSFWTNSTTDLLASTTEKDRQTHTRNRCNAEGYESVAMVPLRSGDEIIGLLQINDRRRNRFTLEMIRFFEGLGSSIGIALVRKRQTVELIRSGREKELLLKEIHHRVKNNLQIIASLLRLRTRYSGDERVEEILRESQNRIQAMAAVHSMLYKSANFAEINIGDYIRETATQLFRSYNTNPETVSLFIQAEDVILPIDSAIPCGLMINELVSNVLKHALPDGRRGKIRIEVRKEENRVTIVFADDGVGFPEGIDFRDTETLGLQLVNMLVAQLDGAIEMDRNGGTRYEITLKI